MRTRRYQLNKGICAAVTVLVFALLIGWLPLEHVYAQELGVDLPYDQKWENNSGRTVDNTFRYLLETEDSKSPMPAEGGNIELTGNASGTRHLTFDFSKPGYYHYKVTPQTVKRDSHYIVDKTVYHLMIMVVNGESELEVRAITIRDKDNAKYPALEYENSYDFPPPTQPTSNTNNGGNGAGGNGNGAAAAGPAGPGANVGPQGQNIGNNDVPLHQVKRPDYWALLNLILMILTIIACLADILLYFRREDEDKEDLDIPKRKRRRLVIRITTIIPAVIAVIMFILTENMRLPMKWVDQWTIWMVIWLVISLILAFASKTKKDDDEYDEGEYEEVDTG